jgi:endoglucanase
MVVMPPAYLLPPEAGSGVVALPYLLIETGLRAGELEKLVRVGDVVSFAQEPLELGSSALAGHTLDNRVSVAAVTHCLDILSRRKHAWDVWAVASSQEEIGVTGAFTLRWIFNRILPSRLMLHSLKAQAAAIGAHSAGGGRDIGLGPQHPSGALRRDNQNSRRIGIFPTPRSGAGHDRHRCLCHPGGAVWYPLPADWHPPALHAHAGGDRLPERRAARGRLMAEFISALPLDFMQTLEWK